MPTHYSTSHTSTKAPVMKVKSTGMRLKKRLLKVKTGK